MTSVVIPGIDWLGKSGHECSYTRDFNIDWLGKSGHKCSYTRDFNIDWLGKVGRRVELYQGLTG